MNKDVIYFPMNYMVFAGAASTTFLINHFLYAPYWVGVIGGVLFIIGVGLLLSFYRYGICVLPPAGGLGTGLIATQFFHAPAWIGLASGIAFVVLTIGFGFGLYTYMENKRVRDENWSNIDLSNVIVVTLIAFVLVSLLSPVFLAARNKARAQQEKAARRRALEKQIQEKINPSPSPISPKAAPISAMQRKPAS